VLQEIRENWNGVEALRSKLQLSAYASVGFVGGLYPFELSKAAHNLPFIHAFSVLNETLISLSNEGVFTCKSIMLGRLLDASRSTLHWNDYVMIKNGVSFRNNVAHRGELLERDECWKYIDAIRAELASWSIV